MECLYRILGTNMMGDRITLNISPIEDEKELGVKDVMNVGKFMKTIQGKADKSRNPDKISIPIDEFNKNDYNLGDIISIKVVKG